MPSSMKAVLFDLDETILDRTESLRDFVMWQAQGMLRNAISNPNQFSQRFIDLDSKGKVWKDKVYSDLVEEFQIKKWSVSELLLSYELCFSGFCKPKNGVLEAIKKLKERGLKLGLVSNGKSPFQERNFEALGVSSLFDAVIVSEAVGYRKPQREIFELACKCIGVEPAQTVFVGDNPVADIDGANNCGMFTVFIPGRFGETYEKANSNCSSFAELVDIVQNAI